MVRLYDRDGGADEYVELEIESINPNGFVMVFTEITIDSFPQQIVRKWVKGIFFYFSPCQDELSQFLKTVPLTLTFIRTLLPV